MMFENHIFGARNKTDRPHHISDSNVLVIFRVLFASFLAFLLTGCFSAYSQKQAGEPSRRILAERPFELHEMDMHLHAGMECPVDLNTWLDLAVRDGRKVLLLLDHLELYRKSRVEYETWAKENSFEVRYGVGPKGHRALMASFDEARKRDDILIFKGWEIYEGELDYRLETKPMKLADVLGWHISPNNGRKPPDGQSLIKRAKQLKALQEQFPVPMILFHPFTMRLENIQRTVERQRRSRTSLTVKDYRFFKPGEQEKLADILRRTSIYIEISGSTDRYWDDPVTREALIADIRPLAEAGVHFTVSTDNHELESAKQPFRPERYCKALGITLQNTNTIIEDLLSRGRRE